MDGIIAACMVIIVVGLLVLGAIFGFAFTHHREYRCVQTAATPVTTTCTRHWVADHS